MTEDTRKSNSQRRKFGGRRKVCIFCVDQIDTVDYKDLKILMSLSADTIQGEFNSIKITFS